MFVVLSLDSWFSSNDKQVVGLGFEVFEIEIVFSAVKQVRNMGVRDFNHFQFSYIVVFVELAFFGGLFNICQKVIERTKSRPIATRF